MIVSFCGSQDGMTAFQQRELKKKFEAIEIKELITGDAVGSDLQAVHIAISAGCRIFTLYPSIFSAKRAFTFPVKGHTGEWVDQGEIRYRIMPPDKPLIRNQRIIDHQDSSIVIATPKEFKHTLRSGTWATIRYAWKRKKDVVIIPPIKSEEENEVSEENNK